ncbi:hypothetical protein TNCV_173241 [Trichonephila clavipes]|nr:hypothetical protein TNCV_173241 [Trichonephila clavipes]
MVHLTRDQTLLMYQFPDIVLAKLGTLNSRRAASSLVMLEEREERWETLEHPQGVLPQNWGGTDQNRTVTCTVL